MIDNVPFLVVGVMEKKAQDSSYSGRDQDKAFIPDTTFKGLFTERYVEQLHLPGEGPEGTPEVVPAGSTRCWRAATTSIPPTRKPSACGTRPKARSSSEIFFGTFRAFLAIIGSFTLIVGGIGVSNIMYVVVEERTREIGVKLAVGAKPRSIQAQFLIETLLLTGGRRRRWASRVTLGRLACSRPRPRRVRGHAGGLAAWSSS